MYLIFHYLNYYPYGGMGDYKGEANSVDELITSIRESLKNYDEVDVCTINDGKLSMIGNVTDISFLDAIGVDGWLRELQKKEEELCK
jgi:hypothetical protein